MSGDNLYGKQPLKFYSEHLTITKISLIEHLLNESSKDSDNKNLEDKLKVWQNLLTE